MAKAEKDPKKADKSKKRKKLKKDKWGQPLPSALAAAAEDEVEAPVCDNVSDALATEEQKDEFCYEPKKVVVSGMPYTSTADEIREFFQDLGVISQIRMSTFPDSGNFSGLAFLTFKTEEIATKALELDGTKMGSRFIKVERCRRDPQKKRKSEFLEDPKKVDGCYSAYIGNLAWNVTEDDIRSFFDKSEITSLRLAVNKKTGQFRGFGHIDFADEKSLEEAIAKNQVELHDRPIKIAYAVSNKH